MLDTFHSKFSYYKVSRSEAVQGLYHYYLPGKVNHGIKPHSISNCFEIFYLKRDARCSGSFSVRHIVRPFISPAVIILQGHLFSSVFASTLPTSSVSSVFLAFILNIAILHVSGVFYITIIGVGRVRFGETSFFQKLMTIPSGSIEYTKRLANDIDNIHDYLFSLNGELA